MIFDTDVLIWASRSDLNAARLIDQTTERAISIVSLMELLQGACSKMEPVRSVSRSGNSDFASCLSESIGSATATLIEHYSLARHFIGGRFDRRNRHRNRSAALHGEHQAFSTHRLTCTGDFPALTAKSAPT